MEYFDVKQGDRIYFGKDIAIQILEIRDYGVGRVKLGVIAPREVIVNREEVEKDSYQKHLK